MTLSKYKNYGLKFQYVMVNYLSKNIKKLIETQQLDDVYFDVIIKHK